MMVQVLSYLLLLSDLVLSMKLEGHYKFWDSASSIQVYDYSLNSRHMELSTCSLNSYYFTDRGLYFRDKCQLNLPNNSYNSSTATNDSVFSIWIYHISGGRIFCLYDINKSTSDHLLRIFLYPTKTSSFTLSYQRQDIPAISQTYNTPGTSLYGSRWRFMVFKFNQEGNNTKISIFCNSIQIFQYTTENFYINSHTNKWIINSAGGVFKGIINELFWNSGVSNVSDLDSIMRSSIFYVPEYSLSLPSYDYTRNSLGIICPDTCTTNSLSCDSKLECIKAQETSCLYNLLETSTNHCIFNCPNNSCICSTAQNAITFLKTFTCSCKIGYKKIVESPIACIHSECSLYTSQGYKHTCTQCQEGYQVGCEGDCCVCDIDYVKVVDSPIECTLNIENCIEYIKIVGQWICNGCSVGYKLDPYGKCYSCDNGYSKVSSSPFTCGIEILRCVVYGLVDDEVCEYCGVGYKVGCLGKCCECDTEGGYLQVAENPALCVLALDRCLSYEKYESSWGCNTCEEGHEVDLEFKCSQCQEEYEMITEDPLNCLTKIRGCDTYKISETGHSCSECESDYFLCSDKCCECDSGFYLPKSKLDSCPECPSNCSQCREDDEGLKCTYCKYGYAVISNMCECDLEDFYMKRNSCEAKPFEVSLTYDFNSVVIQFSKQLTSSLAPTDYTITFYEELDQRLLTYSLQTIEEKKQYVISFNFHMNVNKVFEISLTFSDKVLDRQQHSLVNRVQYLSLHLEVEGITQRNELCDASCAECELKEGRLVCSKCYDYAENVEGLCKCFNQDTENTPSLCPVDCGSGYTINTNNKTCEPSQEENETSSEDESAGNSNSLQDTKKADEYSEFSSRVSTAFLSSAFALGSALDADKVWSLMNTIQIYTYLPLFQVDMPLYLKESLKSQDSSAKYFEYFSDYFDKGPKPFSKAVDFKYKSANLMQNATKPFVVLLCIICMHILMYMIHKVSKGKIHHYSGIVLNQFYLNIYLRYYIQIYLDLLIPCLIQLIYVIVI